MEEPQNIIDISLKALIRRQPNALLRLVGMEVDLGLLRIEDANINNPELHADNVLILDAPEIPEPFAIYLEYQLQPKPDLLATWFTKCGGLTKQLGLPVLLLVVYVTKGNYATFPGRYLVTRGPLTTNFDFTVIKLWEHASQIASGMFPELAPLLVLCEDTPTEATVAREVALIRQSQLPVEVQSELLAIALSIATRSFRERYWKPYFERSYPCYEMSLSLEIGLLRPKIKPEPRSGKNWKRQGWLVLGLRRPKSRASVRQPFTF